MECNCLQAIYYDSYGDTHIRKNSELFNFPSNWPNDYSIFNFCPYCGIKIDKQALIEKIQTAEYKE
jgi:hypothetical protein